MLFLLTVYGLCHSQRSDRNRIRTACNARKQPDSRKHDPNIDSGSNKPDSGHYGRSQPYFYADAHKHTRSTDLHAYKYAYQHEDAHTDQHTHASSDQHAHTASNECASVGLFGDGEDDAGAQHPVVTRYD